MSALDAEKEREIANTVRATVEALGLKPQSTTIEGGKIDTKQPWEQWPRKVELYTGNVPVGLNDAQKTRFMITETCKVKDAKDGTVCNEPLVVERYVNYHFVPDKAGKGKNKPGGGGTLEYDWADARYYKTCVYHGPKPAGAPHW